MPIARFQMPDGRVARFEVPEGTTPEQAQAMIKQHVSTTKPQDEGVWSAIKQGAGDLTAGLVRGAGSIGSTILLPADMVNQKLRGEDFWSMKDNKKRRSDIDAGLAAMGANPDSMVYKGGKLVGEIAGTAGAGGALANGVRSVPMLAKAAPKLATALESGGFKIGKTATTIPGMLGNAAIRTGAGAAVGGASAGLVNPEDAGMGALIGGAMPGVFKVAGEAGKLTAKGGKAAARTMMQRALKPTIADLKAGNARIAIDTLLDYGISPNQKGVEKIQTLVGGLNDEVANRIANSNEVVYKSDVMPYLMKPLKSAMSQVDPMADVNAVAKVGNNFLNHPSLPGPSFPVQAAQNIKQGTQTVLRKKYGQLGSAEIEAQKSLARGLREQISKKVPGVAALNAEEQRLIKTMNVAERRALMELNKNKFGLALLAKNKEAALAFLADRSAAFQALAARMINQASKAPNAIPAAENLLANPLVRTGGLLAIEANP